MPISFDVHELEPLAESAAINARRSLGSTAYQGTFKMAWLDLRSALLRFVCIGAITLHFMEYHLMLQAELNDLTRQKTILLSQKFAFLTSKIEKTKGDIVTAMDAAALQMCQAADTALDAAVTRLEKANGDSWESMGEILRRVTNIFSEVKGAQGIYVSLKGITDMKTALADMNSLKELIHEARLLKDATQKLKLMPITQMEVSDRFTKIRQLLDDFNFIVCDGVVTPQILPSDSNREKRKGKLTTTVNTDITMATSPAQLYVGGLRPEQTEDQLMQYFAQYGVVTKCCIWRNFRTHESKCSGFVTFKEVVCASRALADRPHHIDGTLVKLAPFTSKEKRSKSAVPPLSIKKAPSIDSAAYYQLVVDGLPPVARVNDIRSLFDALQAAVSAAPPRLKGMKLRVSLPEARGQSGQVKHHQNVDEPLSASQKNDICSPLSRPEKVNRVKICETTETVSAAPLRLSDTNLPIAKLEDYESRPNFTFNMKPASSLADHFSGLGEQSEDKISCNAKSGLENSTSLGNCTSIGPTCWKDLKPELKRGNRTTGGCLLQ
ncbi:DAZ-associated protein 1 [Taenia crassiceps]|uniref:DAZ-associated protein 1 n=1 Tax=Taenia crassiceps TaxID=6207 RepID=A0ABR4Q1T9_9CEST